MPRLFGLFSSPSSQVRPVSLSANPGLSRPSFVLSSEPRDSVRSFFASTARLANNGRRSCLAKRSTSPMRPSAQAPQPKKSALQRNAAILTVSTRPTGILWTAKPAASANGGRKMKKSVSFVPENDTVSTVTRWIETDRTRHVHFSATKTVEVVPRWINAPAKRVTFADDAAPSVADTDVRFAPSSRRFQSVHVPYASRRSLFPAPVVANDTLAQSTAQVDGSFTLVLPRRSASQTQRVLTSEVRGGPNLYVVMGLVALTSLVSSFFW
ncbi:uncharacterized protein BDV14DRAFT_8219 [Aspergillus stella-maris]|uniref:uncharacterized protein n=1 Tax=Aspergillus stella-maris TaxID=1810926 RepID=UPI003CCE3555